MSNPLRRPWPPARASRSRLLALCLSSATLLALVTPLTTAPAGAADVDAEGYVDIALFKDGIPPTADNPTRAFPLPDGPLSELVPAQSSWDVNILGVSARGDRLVALEIDAAGACSRLTVRDINGLLVRVLASYGTPFAVTQAALSPSGERVAWAIPPNGVDAPVVVSQPVSGGPSVTIDAAELLGFADEDLLVVRRERNTELFTARSATC